MPTSTISIPTILTEKTALNRIKYLAEDLLEEHGHHVLHISQNLDNSHSDIVLNLGGYTLTGNLIIFPGQVRLEITYPWTALPYKKRVEQEIREILSTLLS
ncbi:polyhydroxyalkanoic acid system family protein [Desulfonatronovibrio hydrogenovorans]|uniref:polyhydroxyalkanoic acid system family protein n=1 Tax=Desulfonatronovibrio hydrogenovorans TaxID=53245 RepID=UPI00048D062C|nr:polyhydroxyalkanoic acid system family protein [Desulfonatronovibrio hydrogenovorans]